MSQLILPARFNQQPLGNPEVDWSDPQAKGLLSVWPFTDGFRDIANRGQDQVVYNSPTLQGTPGRRAALFNGTNQYVNAYIPPITPATISGSWTLMFWARNSNWTTRQSFCGSRNPSEFGMDLKINGTGLGDIAADIGNGTTFLTNPNWTVPAKSGEWGFYALVASPTGINLYFNGVAYGLNTYSGSPLLTDATHQFYIGQMGQSAEWFGGNLSDFRIYTRAVSAPEVQAVFKNTWGLYRKQRRLFFVSSSGTSASATQTDGADTQAATGTPLITSSAAQTDSADTQVASASIGTAVSASAAQTDGTDTQAATATPLITSSAAQTDGADTQSASGTPLITSSAAQTDGADTQAATGTPLITSSAAQTDGADTQNAHAAPITGIAASAAQTDSADTQAATGTPLITSSATQTDPTDIQVATVYVAFIDANLADLFACQQAAVSQYYTGSKPTPLNFQVFITSGSWTVPANTKTVYVSATAAGGSPFGGAGQQALKQQIKAAAGDTVSVTIGQTVAVSVNGAQQLFLNPGGAYGKFQAQAWGQSSYIQGFGNGADTGSGDPALAVILWN